MNTGSPGQRPQSRPTQAALLAELTQRLQTVRAARQVASAQAHPAWLTDPAHPDDSPGMAQLRETWAQLATEAQVARASARAPDNAGPLNSHLLVLRSLSLMQSLSPHYLRRFVALADTLLWLEKAHPQPSAMSRAGRRKSSKTTANK